MSVGLTNATQSPFPGLRPFLAEDAAWFFGREVHTSEIIRKLWEFRFVSVVGNSGSGKSSLLRAGVIPKLLREEKELQIVIFRPGSDPIKALTTALHSAAEKRPEITIEQLYDKLIKHEFGLVEALRLLYPESKNSFLFFVDQFEELFRFQKNSVLNEVDYFSQHFVKLLLAASRQIDLPVYIILTIRSDFIGDCELLDGLPEAINEGQFLVPRLKPEELKLSIEGPIRKAGLRINPELVERLVREARYNPDQLPVLQHALMRTWEVWLEEGKTDRPIDFTHYERTGGVLEALSKHAEEAFNELNDLDKAGCALIFKALTIQGSGERGIRRPQSIEKLIAITGLNIESIQRILAGFRDRSRGFLMPPSHVPLLNETVVDISHESLMRVWSRLSSWVEEEAEASGFYLRLVDNARLYDQGLAGLWRDPDLQLAINWKVNHQPNEVWASQYQIGLDRALSFIEASKLYQDQLLVNKSRQVKQRWVLTLVLVVVLSLLSVWAMFERNKAEESAKAATQQRDRAVMQEKATMQARIQAEKNLKLAKINQEIADKQRKVADQQRKEALKQKDEADKQRQIALLNANNAALQTDAAQRATTLAEREKSEAIRSRQLAEKERENADYQRQIAEQAVLNARKMRLLALSKNLAIQARLGVEGTYPEFHIKPALALAAWKMNVQNGGDPDDREFYTSLLSGQRWLSPLSVYQNKNAGKLIRSIAFSSDGQLLFSASDDGRLRLHDAQMPEQVLDNWSTHYGIINQVLVLPGSQNRIILLHNRHLTPVSIENGKLIQGNSIALPDKTFNLVAVSQDEFVTISPNQVNLWHFTNHSTLEFNKTLLKAASIEWSAACGKGDQIMLGTTDGRVGKLMLDGKIGWESIKLKSKVLALCMSGSYWAAGSSKGDAILVHGSNYWPLNGHDTGISQMVMNIESQKIASASVDGKILFWSMDKPDEPPISLQDYSKGVQCLAISPKAGSLASGSRDGTFRTFPLESKILAESIQKLLPKQLSEVEWKRYFGPDVNYEP